MFKITNQRLYPFSKWEQIHSINPSSYIRKGTLQVFHKIRKQYPNDFIVCIGYDRGETQFGLTETFKSFETRIEDVVDRCLEEECSVERTTTPYSDNVFTYNERHATIHCVPLRVNAKTMRPKSNRILEEASLNNNDDKTRKLVLLLHGELPVLQKVFSQFYSVEKEISHLLIVSVQDVNKLFPKFFPLNFYSSTPRFLPSTPSYKQQTTVIF